LSVLTPGCLLVGCADAKHTFHLNANDWGFTQFLALKEVFDTQKGYLVDDKMLIKVEIKVELPENLLYDSKKETGYVGIKNQGATCYLNSWLQTLYNIHYFRRV
jgi:ubiquitin carboxyl-terminal hydrolase 7